MKRTALLSVYDKTGIVEFARQLVALGWEIYASKGTAAILRDAGIVAHDVADLVGEPILGHRVVTLSREIHAALLARPDDADDRNELARLNVPFIDLVCSDLYPLEQEIKNPEATTESIIEKTDMGGPALLRSAAKGRRIVIAKTTQREEVLAWLKSGEADSEAMRAMLAAEAEAVVGRYALESARYTSAEQFDYLIGERMQTCKYGENGWQAPAFLYADSHEDPLALPSFTVVAGVEPSYNNWAEADRHLQTITHIAAGWARNFGKAPTIALGTKHGNPCGAGVKDDPAAAIRAMVEGDKRAIFGGVVMVNFELNVELAGVLLTHGMEEGRRLLDCVIAPAFSPEAATLLQRKNGKCRLLSNPALAGLDENSLDARPRRRYVRGGFLRQPNYTFVLDLNDQEMIKTGELNEMQQKDVILAWAIGSTSNSNTVTLVRDGQLIGNGVGQQDRVGCCELAIKRARDAGHDTSGAAAYSDGFFPFPDGPEVLADAGIEAIWSTSGSVKDNLTQELCRQRGIVLYQLADKKARGFFGH